ncbi:alpha/beta fold hydrolase [Lysobacter sp. CA199]|uniref:alpha/beta fold hydrolase n=1 Tax=Lysobacter sp. CA199 TaxID=3455608 RepID=UPI003F8D5B3F
MSAMPCIVLPGLDGTGELLDDFIAAMAPQFETTAIAYPRKQALGYDELVEFVRPQLPTDEPYLLIGESFSGPIAIRLAAQQPPQLAALALCASFARSPRPPWSPLHAGALPWLTGLMPVHRIPHVLAAAFMLGAWATPRWRMRLGAVLDALEPTVIRHRLDEVGSVDVGASLRQVACPLLYLQATRDRLVSADSRRWIERLAPGTRCVEIQAPHCVLQARAERAAQAIKTWYGDVGGAGFDADCGLKDTAEFDRDPGGKRRG